MVYALGASLVVWAAVLVRAYQQDVLPARQARIAGGLLLVTALLLALALMLERLEAA